MRHDHAVRMEDEVRILTLGNFARVSNAERGIVVGEPPTNLLIAAPSEESVSFLPHAIGMIPVIDVANAVGPAFLPACWLDPLEVWHLGRKSSWIASRRNRLPHLRPERLIRS